MFNLYLLIGLVTTFLSVVLLSYAVATSGADKRRALRFLENSVGETRIDLRETELQRSLLSRALTPLLNGAGAMAKRVTPKGMAESMERKIGLAGLSDTTSPDQLITLKVVGAISAFALVFLFSSARDATPGSTILVAAFFGAIAYFAPDTILSGRADGRQDKIRKALPDTMDLLTISVEAGLGLDAAIARVVQNVPGPLSDEFNRLLHEMRLGMSRTEALKQLKNRTDLEELDAFVLAITQADTFGVSIANVLRAQSVELRTKRRQRAEEKAMKIPVKILFPLIFCVLPALFVVIIGPGVIRIAQSLIGAG